MQKKPHIGLFPNAVLNPKSELTGAGMGTNEFGYAYDPIGNRTSITNNGEPITYQANALNQYTNISDGVTIAPTFDLDGEPTRDRPAVREARRS